MSSQIETMIEENKNLIYSIANSLYINNKVFSKEDLVQVGFLAICKSGHKYDSRRGRMSTFITHCARNDMLKFIQANKMNSELLYEDSHKLSYTEDEEILKSDLVDYFNLKSEIEKRVILLKRGGESNRSIAKQLNISSNKVSEILSKIRERLATQHA